MTRRTILAFETLLALLVMLAEFNQSSGRGGLSGDSDNYGSSGRSGLGGDSDNFGSSSRGQSGLTGGTSDDTYGVCYRPCPYPL